MSNKTAQQHAASGSRPATAGEATARGVWGPEARLADRRVFAATLAALILLPPALILPVMTTERFGHRQAVGILDGCRILYDEGQWLLFAVVALCSVVVPYFKVTALFLLGWEHEAVHPRHRILLNQWLEWVGRFGMLDVFLVTFLIAALKIGHVVEVHAGPGAVFLALVVILSILASTWYDPGSAEAWDRLGEAAEGEAPEAETETETETEGGEDGR